MNRDRVILIFLVVIQISIIAFYHETNVKLNTILEAVLTRSNVSEVEESEEKQAMQTAVSPATVSPALPAYNGVPFSNVTEFNEQNGKEQAYIDMLKQRYETWIITYYYLQKCGKTEKNDYEFIMASLKKELETAKAENGVLNNILVAANGSYKELYSEIACDDQHITTSKTSYDTYMQQAKTSAANVTVPKK